MKVDLLIKGLGLGGAERHVVDCAVELKRRGHDVAVFYFLPRKNALVAELLQHGVETECIGTHFFFGPIAALAGFVRIVRIRRPDVVHAHLPIPGVVARLVKPLFGYRLVYTEHNLYQRLNAITRTVHRLTRGLDDCAISCSEPVALSLPWPSIVVENGISVPAISDDSAPTNSLRRNYGFDEDDVVFISVANLLKKKNHSLMIDAFATAFPASYPDQRSHLVLVGQDGSERVALEERAIQLGVAHRVHFYGSHPSASSLLSDADVFCLSSTFEGLPIALLESMAAGIPAIVTNVGGMPDAVVDGVTGRVVESGDIGGYARAFLEMHESKAGRSRMGLEARARVVGRFSHAAMMDSILDCYSNE